MTAQERIEPAASIGLDDWQRLEATAPLPADLREHVFLDAAGTLHVSDLKASGAAFRGWLRRVAMLGITLTPSTCTAAEMRSLRETARGHDSAAGIDSDMQKRVMQMLAKAAADKASDVHLTLMPDRGELEYRINGDLERQVPPYEHDEADRMMATTMNSMISGEGAGSNKPLEIQDARISNSKFLPPNVSSARIIAGPISGGRSMVFRLLYKDTDSFTGSFEERFSKMGYSAQQVADLREIAERPAGILVLAGVTNSGKSTTLKHYFETLKIERPQENMLSVEDPVEYHLEGIKQQSVNRHGYESANAAFNAHVRFALRADPDRAMIGELRDRETFNLAITFTRTGHPIGTTLHASRWYAILERAADEIRSPEMADPLNYLAQSDLFSGLAYQRLTKGVCPHCGLDAQAHKDRLPPSVLAALVDLLGRDDLTGVRLINPTGCDAPNCRGGVAGRTVLAEVVPTNPVLMQVIRDSGVAAGTRYWREQMGGKSIYDHAREKLLDGAIDPVSATDALGPLNSELINERRWQAFVDQGNAKAGS